MSEIKLAALIQARLSSERCKGKMLRPFAGTTLIDVALEKFAGRLSVPLYFAVHEPDLIYKYAEHAKLSDYDFRLLCRNKKSAAADDIGVVMNYLDRIDADFIMMINPCHAFLTIDTVEETINEVRGPLFSCDPAAKSLTSTITSQGWYYDAQGCPINHPDPRCLDTKRTWPLTEVAHAFHVFNKHRFIDEGIFWRNAPLDPVFHCIPPVEALDIDTELDFEVAEALWKARRGGNR